MGKLINAFKDLSFLEKVFVVGMGGGVATILSVIVAKITTSGFGDTPVELWRRTSIPTSTNIAHNRAQARDLQSLAISRKRWAHTESERKQRKEDAVAAAEARRKERLWRRARRRIDTAS